MLRSNHLTLSFIISAVTLFALLITDCAPQNPSHVSAPSPAPENVIHAVLASSPDDQAVPDKIFPAPHIGYWYLGGNSAIVITKYTLGSNLWSIHGIYRSFIETKAGAFKAVVVEINTPLFWMEGLPNYLSQIGQIKNIDLNTTGFPANMSIWQDLEDHIFPGYGNKTLFIEIPQGVQLGDYKFEIGIEVDGINYGNLPCTIRVDK